MLKRKLLTVTLGILLALALGYGLLRLFAIRWERGDVYPAYSTLRADPLGMRVLFEAIEMLPGIDAERNFRALEEFRPGVPVTLVYAGVPSDAKWGAGELRHFESLIANGSRAVFAFEPEELKWERLAKKKKEMPEVEAEAEKSEAEPEARPEPAGDSDEQEKKKVDSSEPKSEKESAEKVRPPGSKPVEFEKVAERWGFKFSVAKAKRAGSFHGAATATDAAAGLEQELSWHSALHFTDLQPPWRVLYRVGGEPVVIERRWGDGTIVLAADSFFLSNEALMQERRPSLLAWLIGSPRTVIFDEEHLGVAEATGLMSLARKYRLQGALMALVVVALLWIWRQSVRFVPVNAAVRESREYIAGLDSHAGFISLLRRTVPPARVLDVCLEEWRKTFVHDTKALTTVDLALADATPSDSRKADPASTYQAVTRALKKHRNRPA